MYLTQALHRAVQQNPDKVAVRCGGRTRTFRGYAERVARLASALQQLGMRTGDRVAMLSLNSDRYLEYQMAVPWGGGVLNPCNIRWSVPEILYSLEDSRSSILLVDETFRPMVDSMRGQSRSLREVIYCGDGATPAGMHSYEGLLEAATPVPDAYRHDEDLAGIFYTGGTTGFPKGVMLSHTNLCSSGLALHAEHLAPPGGCYLHAAPMFHLADMGMASPQWHEGNTHSIVPMFSPEGVLNAIESDRVTHILLVPTMIQMLVDHPAMRQARDLSSLKCIAYGASPISEPVLNRALDAFPGVDFVQAYGMTELSPLATVNPAYSHTVEGRKRGKLRSAGRASYCTEVRIVDTDDAEVPRGTVGEVVVRGPNVMQGYWNMPEQTAAAVRDGWMHTGDGAYMDDDGYIFVVDRLKDMIISGGENIYSAEVENAITQHPAVVACAVIGIPSDEWGESVHAVVVRKPADETPAEVLITHCKSLIAGYKCPRSVAFIDALPLSGAGKVLKTRLREPFWEAANATSPEKQFLPSSSAEVFMSQDVYVSGIGMIPFTKPGANRPYPEMAAEAARIALQDAGIDYAWVQQAYVGYVYGDSTAGQRAVYELGMTGIPVVNVNNNCSTGSTALFLARQAVASGAADCVLALGFEQMSPGALGAMFADRPSPFDRFEALADELVGDAQVPLALRYFGGAGLAHMQQYGTQMSTFAKIRAKASRHASNNPLALFRTVVTEEEVMASATMWPGVMTRLMACPPTCGAAAAIVCSARFAERHGLDRRVRIRAQAMTTDRPVAFEARDMREVVGFSMARDAAQQVYEAAGVGAQDLDVVELHDCFAHNELLSYEALGLCPVGGAEQFVLDGDNTYGGKVVTNPSGGLLSKGHPLGATGLAQCTELVQQLRGTADKRQVEGARMALQHNLGLGGACVVTLYERT